MKFEKLEATGNDFVFIDQRQVSQNVFVDKKDRPPLVKKIADRHFGVGADGVVFIEDMVGNLTDVQWDFYNEDGSSAEMCGNAARCMGRWGLHHGLSSSFFLHTLSGPVEIRIKSESCSSVLIPGAGLNIETLSSGVEGLTGQLINTGVPHVVVEADMSNSLGNEKIIREFRWHRGAGERGANVTLFSKEDGSSYFAKTFERGVENFTLSCGTGVLAVAVNLYKHGSSGELQITTPGGRLIVRRISGDQLELEGPAALVFSGEWRKV